GQEKNAPRIVTSKREHDALIEFGAGGPLLRFGIERDSTQDLTKTVSTPLPADQALSDVIETRDVNRHRSLRRNAALIGALVAAMLLGAVAGLVASSSMRRSGAETMSFAEVAELNSPAVVFVRAEFELLDSSGQVTMTEARTGSGFVCSASGLIVTNRHVIRDWDYNTLPAGM